MAVDSVSGYRLEEDQTDMKLSLSEKTLLFKQFKQVLNPGEEVEKRPYERHQTSKTSITTPS
jgi:hypothetical protein